MIFFNKKYDNFSKKDMKKLYEIIKEEGLQINLIVISILFTEKSRDLFLENYSKDIADFLKKESHRRTIVIKKDILNDIKKFIKNKMNLIEVN